MSQGKSIRLRAQSNPATQRRTFRKSHYCNYLRSENQSSTGEVSCIASDAEVMHGACMTRRRFTSWRTSTALSGLLVLLCFVIAAGCAAGEPAPAAVSTFDSYVNTVESRLSQRHGSQSGFLAPVGSGQ